MTGRSNGSRYARRRVNDTLLLEPDRRLAMWDSRDGEHYVLGPDGLTAWAQPDPTTSVTAPQGMADGLYRDSGRYNDLWIVEHHRLTHLTLTPALPIDRYGPWRRHRFTTRRHRSKGHR